MSMKKRFFMTVAMVAALFCAYSFSAAAMGTDVKTTNAAVNLRTGPGTGYAIITVIPSGTTLYIEQDMGDWLFVDYNTAGGTLQGYISSRYVGTPQQPAVVYPVSNGSLGSQTVNADVNLRSGPSTAYPKYVTVPYGATVYVNSSSNGWSFVTYNGINGYMASQYIGAGNGYASSSSKKGNIAYAGEEVLTSSDFTNMYNGASTGSGVVQQLCAGSRLLVLDRNNGWYKVSYNGYNGWIPATALCKALGGPCLTT